MPVRPPCNDVTPGGANIDAINGEKPGCAFQAGAVPKVAMPAPGTRLDCEGLQLVCMPPEPSGGRGVLGCVNVQHGKPAGLACRRGNQGAGMLFPKSTNAIGIARGGMKPSRARWAFGLIAEKQRVSGLSMVLKGVTQAIIHAQFFHDRALALGARCAISPSPPSDFVMLSSPAGQPCGVSIFRRPWRRRCSRARRAGCSAKPSRMERE